jgi:hypothetical protein
MAAQPGSISAQAAANTLTGGELLPLDQEIGSPVAATALVVGQGYRIVSLGTTNWQTCGAGATAAVGTVFKCEATGTGTGTAQRVDTRKATAQAIAALAGVAAAITAHGAEADPHPGYTTAQELATALQAYLTTAAAAQAYQPLDSDLTAIADLAGQTAFGRAFLALVNEAGARDYIGIGPDDSLTLTGLTLTGLATLPHIHGGLAGELYAHVKNSSGGALAAVTPLRITGTVGDTATLEVAPADAASSATMPALFVLSQALASNEAGHATMLGEITGVNTAGLTPGAPLFVAVGGGLTATRPASNAQQVATVGRVHATTGSIHVLPWPVLGTAAAAAIGDFATAAQGTLAASAIQPGALATALASYALLTDPRLTDSREWSASTVTQAEAEAGTATTRRAWTAERVRQAVAAWWNSITSSLGRSLVAATTQVEARGVIGAGTSNLVLGTSAPSALGATASAGSAETAAPIDHIHPFPTAAQVGAASPAGTGLEIQFRSSSTTFGAAFGSSVDAQGNVTLGGRLTAKDQLTLSDDGSFTIALQTAALTRNQYITYPNATGTVALVPGISGQTVCNINGSLAATDTTYDPTTGTRFTKVFGYGSNSGGTVTQATNKSTGVTLNTPTGRITMNSANLAANAVATFTLTNSQISATDVVATSIVSGGTQCGYVLDARAAAGSATISLRNVSGGDLAEAVVIAFAVIKASID